MATKRSNKRKQRNRGRFGFLYKFLSLVIILVVLVAGCVVFFRVETVTVSGESRYTAEEVVQASGILQGDNLILLSRMEVARRIMSELPYVENVSVRRALPDGVVIAVEECRPAAVIQGEESSNWWIINAAGKILEEASSGDVQGTAKISGLTAYAPAVGTMVKAGDENAMLLEDLLSLMQALEEQEMLEKVRAIDMSGGTEIAVDYDGWITLEIDASADFAEEASMLKVIIDSGDIQSNERGTIIKTQGGWYSFVPEGS